MSTKEFVAETFRWLHQINGDTELLAVDVRVALQLTRHFNEDDQSGRAYPGCKHVGDQIGLSERTVDRSVRRMHAHGHLRVIWGRQGRKHPNQYWMLLKPPPVEGKKTRTIMRVSEPEKTGTTVRVSEVEKPASEVKKTRIRGQENPHCCAGEPKESQKGIGESAARAPGLRDEGSDRKPTLPEDEVAAAFDRFWKVYPRRTAKTGAREEFSKALQRATAEQIIEGARRYAVKRQVEIAGGDEERYTLGPIRWLADGHWEDDDGATTTIDQYGNPVSEQQRGNGHDLPDDMSWEEWRSR